MLITLLGCENTIKNEDVKSLKSISLYFWEDSKYLGDTVNQLKCTNLFYSTANPEFEETDSTNNFISDTVRFFSLDTVSQFETYLFEISGGYYVDIFQNTATIRKK